MIAPRQPEPGAAALIPPLKRVPPVTIGLVNNLRGAGAAASEGRFRTLIETAAGDRAVTFRCYALPGLAAPEAAGYHDMAPPLAADPPDGLIITGAEPATEDLAAEACFTPLTRLIDMALARRTPMIFSCLAAHAAVLHLTGINRRRLPAKRSGVLAFTARGGHPLLRGAGARIMMPHSRWNDLDAAVLVRHGYTMLTLSDQHGVDAFTHPDMPGWLFFQGHPEYEAGTLASEYRRDVQRSLQGTARYPDIPAGYFGPDVVAALAKFETMARSAPNSPLMPALPPMPSLYTQAVPWRKTALILYRNWLDSVFAAAGNQPRNLALSNS